MSYIVAGYTVALSALFAYGVSLLARKRRLERRLVATRPGDAGRARLP